MTDWRARFERLRDAVRAYDAALQAYGIMGDFWVEGSTDLDTLYANILAALEPEENPA